MSATKLIAENQQIQTVLPDAELQRRQSQ